MIDLDNEMLARKMSAFKMVPDYVLCSPAKRARETYECMERILPSVAIIYPEKLYNASADELLGFIKKLTNTSETALVVAHNPGIHNLATRLAGKGDHERLASMSYGFRPGTMAVIKAASESWDGIELGQNKLVQLVTPD
jgi:phosphohistidine phosphatase